MYFSTRYFYTLFTKSIYSEIFKLHKTTLDIEHKKLQNKTDILFLFFAKNHTIFNVTIYSDEHRRKQLASHKQCASNKREKKFCEVILFLKKIGCRKVKKVNRSINGTSGKANKTD